MPSDSSCSTHSAAVRFEWDVCDTRVEDAIHDLCPAAFARRTEGVLEKYDTRSRDPAGLE